MQNCRKRFLVIFMIGFINLGIEVLQGSPFDKIAVACTALGIRFSKSNSNNESINFMDPQDDNIDALKYPNSDFAKFVKKYRCSREIEGQIHEHECNKTGVLFHPAVQEYHDISFYNKGNNLERITHAERMKEVIAKHKLDSIGVPDKCLCYMYGDVWNVIAKKVDKSDDPLKLSLQEVQQLKIIADETLYMDFHYQNIVRDNQGKLMIIDTEYKSYAPSDCDHISFNALCRFIGTTNKEKEITLWIDDQKKLKDDQRKLKKISNSIAKRPC